MTTQQTSWFPTTPPEVGTQPVAGARHDLLGDGAVRFCGEPDHALDRKAEPVQALQDLTQVRAVIEQFEAMTARMPNSRWREIPGTNHYTIVIGHPPETATAIREFLVE